MRLLPEDHVELPGAAHDFSGAAEGAVPDPHDQGEWRRDAGDHLYTEFNALPDGARGRDSLPVRIKTYARLTWYCEGESGKYVGKSDLESVLDSAKSAIEVAPRCEDFRARDYQFTAIPACGDDIALRTSLIRVEFTPGLKLQPLLLAGAPHSSAWNSPGRAGFPKSGARSGATPRTSTTASSPQASPRTRFAAANSTPRRTER